ncbi:hypothetical protein EC988_004806 [Linderina pennispora]|nr:hypothetical protein EC988_004806 [Linderina pennispora]
MRFPCLNAIQRFTYQATRNLTTRPPHQRETWTQRDQDRLIRMINTKYRNTVPGNWDVVVQLIKDASANHRKPWTAELLTELQDLVQANFSTGRPLNWTKIARTMGRSPTACFCAFYQNRTHAHPPMPAVLPVAGYKRWTSSEQSRLNEAVEDLGTRDWENVAQRVGSRSPSSCRTFWRSQQKIPSGKWSEKERRRLVEVLEATPKHTRVVPILAQMFPDKSPDDLRGELHRARAALSYHTYSKWTAGRIRTLMDCVKEQKDIDWHSVAEKVGGVTVSMCQTKYQAIRAKSAACGVARWTAEEVDRLDSAVRDTQGRINWQEIARTVGTKTTKQCYVKWYRCLRPAKYPAE